MLGGVAYQDPLSDVPGEKGVQHAKVMWEAVMMAKAEIKVAAEAVAKVAARAAKNRKMKKRVADMTRRVEHLEKAPPKTCVVG